MPIVIIGAGLIIGWLWVRTESIWMVALAHGALNNWGQYAFKFMRGPGQLGDGLVLGAGGLALLAWEVFWSRVACDRPLAWRQLGATECNAAAATRLPGPFRSPQGDTAGSIFSTYS
jgi:hypothetical protein